MGKYVNMSIEKLQEKKVNWVDLVTGGKIILKIFLEKKNSVNCPVVLNLRSAVSNG